MVISTVQFWARGEHSFGNGGFCMVAVWMTIIVGIALLMKWLVATSGKGEGASSIESPIAILKRCYAAVEISKEEFEEKEKDLELKDVSGKISMRRGCAASRIL